MALKDIWEDTKTKAQSGSVTSAFVSNALSIDEDMAACLMEDWMKLLEYEMNKELENEIMTHKREIMDNSKK